MMNDPVNFNVQGLEYKIEYLTQSLLKVLNNILKTQEDIATKINGLDTAESTDTVINKDVGNIIADIELSKTMISSLRGFTGYKEK